MGWVERNKEKVLPEIDWGKDIEKYRNETNIRNMPFNVWFWCHPSAYRLISYGLPIIWIVIFVTLSIWLVNKGWWPAAIIPGIIVIAGFVQLYKKISNPDAEKVTFWDLHMGGNGKEDEEK